MARTRPAVPDQVSGEVANSVTHGIGFVMSIVGAGAMLVYLCHRRGDVWTHAGCLTFLATMLSVYFASTCSHAISNPKLRRWFRQLDQGTIYLFIAGSYTPWAFCYFRRHDWAMMALAIIWAAAIAGFVSKVFLGHRIKETSLVFYILLSWFPVMSFVFVDVLLVVPVGAFLWLFLGGLCYTFGTVFWKLDIKQYHFHAIWHIMVVIGSTCHYFAVFYYTIP